jgi:hypothetical protein
VIYPYRSLPENLAAFCLALRRDYGFRLGPRDLQDAARALETASLADERVVRDVLRPVLAGRLEEARVFDDAFDRFFRGGSPVSAPPDGREPGRTTERQRRERTSRQHTERQPAGAANASEASVETGGARGALSEVSEANGKPPAGLLRTAYSPFDAEGAMPVLEPVDRAWRDAASLLVNRVRAGLSRRWRPAKRGHRFDLRRTLRSSLHTGGDLAIPKWRARPRRRPRFVVLIDGSRSMASHAEPALQIAIALASVTLHVEIFTFSTALRRVTRDVRRAAGGDRRTLDAHYAWGGGTAIGSCLREFLQRHGERLVGRDTVVIIASDGLDVGDPHVLREAMARLSRLSAAILWLNPLLDTPGYEPSAIGMRAARPFADAFAWARDPAALARLASALRVR